MNGTDRFQIDMCHGPLAGKIILFALPLMATYILQLLFNAADLVVIGHCASREAMAAIGASMNPNSLIINFFIGISIGSNVVAARSFGAQDTESMRHTVHSSMAVALYGGIGLMVVALLAVKPLLIWMGTPPEILPMSCRYLWICFAAIPMLMVYNFGCAILRAMGDTRRPLFYLTLAGIINVGMNLFLVTVCGMDVGGVAIATALSHTVSAVLIFRTLCRLDNAFRLDPRKIRIHWPTLRAMLHIGLPAGLQSSCFAISNVLIQSSVNSFGTIAIAGSTAAAGLEGIAYIGSFAFHQTAVSFVAQNYGAGKFDRIRNSMWYCFGYTVLACMVISWGFLGIGHWLLGLFNPDPEVIGWGFLRIQVMFLTYALCGIMDVASGGLRGFGYSLLSTASSLVGACLFRVLWVFWVFAYHRDFQVLFFSYPASWLLTAVFNCTILWIIYRRELRKKRPPEVTWGTPHPNVARGYRTLVNPK